MQRHHSAVEGLFAEERMSAISFQHVTFHYPSSPEPVFRDSSFTIHTSWRTGIAGRNGRGKSTLLQLIHGAVVPDNGTAERSVPTALFPYAVSDPVRPVFEIIKQSIAPFRQMEQSMEELLQRGSDASIEAYYRLFDEYTQRRGFTIDALIHRECADLALDEQTLQRPFATLSGGEQTRAMIAALFLQEGVFPLLDEPTNHLDMEGRELLARYLSRKEGFIVVSHDRRFLDGCCDHMVTINKNDVRVFQGNYSRWRGQLELEERSESARDASLQQEISALETEARQRRSWSAATEKEKNSAFDSGFVSHKAAKMMKRALTAERRIDEHLEEKRSLLRNRETVRPLTLHTLDDAPEILAAFEDVTVSAGGRVLLENFSLTIRRGERIALTGRNGAGKSTLLRMLQGAHGAASGIVRIHPGVRVVHSYQVPLWNSGMLRDHLRREGIDETLFRTAMGTFNIQGGVFGRPLETFSYGERKKVDLCRSFIFPHHLLVWDEPVNYIDIETKEQIEAMVLRGRPSMLFAEHDAAFIDAAATRTVHL
jgi:lincosamide and streptogramin A transport system ATP-binding/permease protein